MANSTAIHPLLALEETIEELGGEQNLVEERRRAFDFRAAHITTSIPVMVVSSIGRSLSVVLSEDAEVACVEIRASVVSTPKMDLRESPSLVIRTDVASAEVVIRRMEDWALTPMKPILQSISFSCKSALRHIRFRV